MTLEEFEQILTRVVHGDNASPEKAIRLPEEVLDRPFDDLDVDSLARAEMMTVISDTYLIEIGDDEAGRLTTPRSMLEFVAAADSRGSS
ncbi:phosphopantetheine-binding protein [Streptomyces sp. BE147]|uniref:acyl carrier protein n=1 Tax=Streptomyces sp. BE147 TaxID=3002524 RepID=UPI002E7A0F06|nr:phosphopantetheine-binding protein [Streptomyces sp. BE147]MEE1740553.1 phosphopantetheine-binding protein [Streptomyces sp. BE147]